ncbi:hypothetical protein [Nevskia sp.]|uniref:hypothetical protein n=1 Tax=Nevskia sp. TaxID=1929292 RepID=UPI0025D492D9|nr:hypothetical protein [Nevskia sp.]
MSDAYKKLSDATLPIGNALNDVLEKTAGCKVAFMVVLVPDGGQERALLFSNIAESDWLKTVEIAKNIINNPTKRSDRPVTPPSRRMH